MRYEFKKIIGIDGTFYTKGVHEVDDKVTKHWYFMACMQNGEIKVVADAPKVVPVTIAAIANKSASDAHMPLVKTTPTVELPKANVNTMVVPKKKQSKKAEKTAQ